MMRLIVNPSSRSGRSRARQAGWLRELARREVPFAVAETTGAGHARELARTAAEPVVVAVGGDGTINEVLDGLLQAPAPRAMGVLYAGTSPDFCRFHGIPFADPHAALETLLRRRMRRIDAARLTRADGTVAHFACGSNIGLGARVAAFANAYRRYLGDVAGTGLGLVLAVGRHRRFAARLVLDGTPHDLDGVNHLLILKNPHIASGLRLDLPLAPDDGALTVLAVHGLSRCALLRLLPAFYTGTAVRHPAVLTRTCRSVSITTDPPQTVEFDGDPRGATPVTIELLPRVLPLICEAPHA
jgi:diacylglycerol kinase family enzyme